MKNLKLLRGQRDIFLPGDNFCVDFENNVFFASAKNLYSWNADRNEPILCAELPIEVEDVNSYIVGMEFLFESNSIFILSSVGDLYLYNIDEKQVSSVGFVETQVESFAWSPDEEFLLVLTGANTLIRMTKDFDALIEKNLSTDDFGESKPVNAGWGSKTTQFHGSEGKGAALIKQKEPKQALPYDDKKSRISWRKDGEYFVTSSVDSDKGYRLLRVWDQEATLQFTSEVVEGIEEPICWRPVGNLIACSQQCPNKHKIIFFEKNGLQHGEFALPFKPNIFKVSTIQWNSDSTILLIVAEVIENPADFHVMLWTSSNYHWYLKQSFKLPGSRPYNSLVSKWSSFRPYELQCFNQKTGEFYQFKWTFSISNAPGSCKDEDSIVASIDNESILVSTFGKLVVPPPLCAYTYSFTTSVQSVFFAPDKAAFGAFLSDFRLALFTKGSDSPAVESDANCNLKLVAAGGNGFKSQVQPYQFRGIYDLQNNCSLPFGFSHWTWAENNCLLCVCYCKSEDKSPKFCLLSADISPASLQTTTVTTSVISYFDSSVNGMCPNADGSVIAVLLEDGRVMKLKLGSEDKVLTPWLCLKGKELVLNQPCSNISILTIDENDHILSLSEKYNLFCGDLIILPHCTSYYIQEEFLLATTIDHILKCFSKKVDIPDAIKTCSPLPASVQSQKIEKGARIVCSPYLSTKVILQMPRGNLETLHPRSLVLSAVSRFLEKLQFGKAFQLAKIHRIDLNILYDYNPKLFLENIEEVIKQLESPSDLNLFLASLKNEDVCITMYPLMFEHDHEGNLSENKINKVCDEFRKVLDTKDTKRYYHTIMATYAKKDPSELDLALKRLKTLKDSNDSKSTQDLVDSALNFLLYLVEIEALKLTALGTYDLETTIMVEQKSQKDPKEFLPFYNMLQSLEENYRKYKIDMHLQRYKQALIHISKCDDHFDECLQLIKEQRLYIDALYLFPPSSDCYKVVWEEYGNYLMDKRYFDEAGLVFTRCEKHDKALLAYRESLNWQMMLCSASSLGYSEMDIILLCQEASQKLKSHQKYLDASYLLEHYVKDIEESIVTLIEGHEWSAALLMISNYKRQDIAETHLKPSLEEHQAYLKLHLDEMFRTFNKHLERLMLLRTQKKKEAETPNIARFAEDELFSDVGSVTDAGSVTSCAESKQMSGSIMTRKSSKSRRKQKLKKYRLKEGSADEDLALIAALAETITKVDTLKDNFLNTLKALVHFNNDKFALELQHQMSAIVKTIEAEIPNIWIPTQNSNTTDMKFGPDSTANSIAASLQQEHKSIDSKLRDPELAAPPWRNINIILQMFK